MWEIGYDSVWNRDIGYGVPATCDHPECHESIDRGLSYLCSGCALFFCSSHLWYLRDHPGQWCSQCRNHLKLTDESWADWRRDNPDEVERLKQDQEMPFSPSPDTSEWVRWKLTDKSWEPWRKENPGQVEKLRSLLQREGRK